LEAVDGWRKEEEEGGEYHETWVVARMRSGGGKRGIMEAC
jgi:hypothetical protein